MINLTKHLGDIYTHFEKEYPREGCGVVGVSKGQTVWIPCTNVALDDEDFIIDSSEYLKIRKQYNIIAIVHSHPDKSSNPSELDKKYCNTLGIPYYIFSFPEMDLTVLEPQTNLISLYGREYEFGVTDCFEAARDYYLQKGIDLPKREAYENFWWKKQLNYFSEDHIRQWNFVKVEDLQKDDLIVFSVNSSVPNHCGVYLGQDIFYHHAMNRLSCNENLYPLWIKSISGIYRYEKNLVS